MIDTFLIMLTPVLTLLSCILVGYFLHIKKILPESGEEVLSKLTNNVLLPAMAVNTFATNCTVESLSTHWDIVLDSFLVLLCAIAVAIPLSKLVVPEGGYTRKIYQYALAFSNAGYVGIPVVQTMFGGDVLYQYLLFLLPVQTMTYTWGIAQLITGRDESAPAWKRLLNPTLAAILTGIVIGLTGINHMIPEFIFSTAQTLGDCMGPMAMLLTGVVIGKYNLPVILKNKRVYIASVLRLIVLPALFLVPLYFIGASDLCLTLCLIAYCSPLGLNTVVIPAAYGQETLTGASMAVVSHILAMFTIPMMYTLLMAVLQ